MTARERIARANALDAARNGRPTAHCDECGRLSCPGHQAPAVPEQRGPSLDSLASRMTLAELDRQVSA